MRTTLRPYQQRGVQQLRQSFVRGARAPLYVAPTGSGKTVLFTHIAEGATARGNHVWILVHRQELLAQTSRALEALGIAHGVIAPGFTPAKELVQVCSVHALRRRIETGKLDNWKLDLLVVDEAHHATAGTWRVITNARPEARILGVTATPARTDGQGLGKRAGGIFDDLVLGPTVKELIAGGYLCRPVVYAPPNQLDLQGVHTRGGDYAANELVERVDKPTITGDAVTHYRRLCEGQPAIAFCVSVAHAQHVAEQFRAAGFRAASIDGSMGDLERKSLIDGLASGRMHVLTSCEIVSEGTDIPVVAAAILLRPTQSLVLFLQQVGRALRPAPGKDRAIILDHVGNVLRHGMPDEDREWSLEGRPKNARDVEPTLRVTQCPECFRAHPPAPVCPECGHRYTADPKGGPEHVEGTLEEVDAEQIERMRRDRRRAVARANTREELEEVARERGYKPAWVDYILRARAERGRRG